MDRVGLGFVEWGEGWGIEVGGGGGGNKRHVGMEVETWRTRHKGET